LIHIDTREKFTNKEIDYKIHSIMTSAVCSFSSKEALIKNLSETAAKTNEKTDEKTDVMKTITTEGFVVKVKDRIIKFQTKEYLEAKMLKPNIQNPWQCYLEVFRSDKLGRYLELCSPNNNEEQIDLPNGTIIAFISTNIKRLSQELTNIYYATRSFRNPEFYNSLGPKFRTALFKIHGKYLANKKKIVMTVHDVYNVIKTDLSISELLGVIWERREMIIGNMGHYFTYVRDQRMIDFTNYLFP